MSTHLMADITQKALIENSGAVLLAFDTEDKLWELPGGRLNDDELNKHHESLQREMSEELGIIVEPLSIFDTFSFTGKSGVNHFAVVYICRPADGKFKFSLGEEVGEVKWVKSYEEALKLPMRPVYYELLNKYFDRK